MIGVLSFVGKDEGVESLRFQGFRAEGFRALGFKGLGIISGRRSGSK